MRNQANFVDLISRELDIFTNKMETQRERDRDRERERETETYNKYKEGNMPRWGQKKNYYQKRHTER